MTNYINSFEQSQTCGLGSLGYEYYVNKHYKTPRHKTRALYLRSQGHSVTDYNIQTIFSNGVKYEGDNEYEYDDDVIMNNSTMEDDVESMSFTNDTFSLGYNDEEYLGSDSVAEDDFDSDSGLESSELGSYTFTFRAKPFFFI
ncbi:hypothetical protein MFLAVUS_003877 [Mucor flavus]|uniref:Uncharacterized protein n=1 Tax=Mucor flavus TaxID=439312 RepID=A0ABP9YUD8_9FUNG